MNKLFIVLAKRLKSKTPKLFNKIAIGAAVIGVAALLLPSLPITLPIAVTAVLPIISSACAGVASVSLLTTDDEKLISDTNKILEKK